MSLKGLQTLLSRTLSILVVCLIAGCGFAPMYGEDASVSGRLPAIKIATISERHGQVLRNHLLDLLTPKGTPKRSQYILETDLNIKTRDIGIRRDETANRKQVTIKATITLLDSKTFLPVHRRTITTFNSFTLRSHDYYATEIGEDAAIKEALRLTAQKIKLDLAAFLLHYEN